MAAQVDETPLSKASLATEGSTAKKRRLPKLTVGPELFTLQCDPSAANAPSTQLHLTNAHSQRMVYRLRTTNPDAFVVKPRHGIIDANRTEAVTISLQKGLDLPQGITDQFQLAFRPLGSDESTSTAASELIAQHKELVSKKIITATVLPFAREAAALGQPKDQPAHDDPPPAKLPAASQQLTTTAEEGSGGGVSGEASAPKTAANAKQPLATAQPSEAKTPPSTGDANKAGSGASASPPVPEEAAKKPIVKTAGATAATVPPSSGSSNTMVFAFLFAVLAALAAYWYVTFGPGKM